MSYAIMRCKKIGSMGGAASSLEHAFRERDTPNADPLLTPHNTHYLAASKNEAMGRLRDLLPEKRRKDAVLAVEYVMTASPEWWRTATKEQQQEFFKRSRQWLADKYGQDRIVVATVHKDERTPHLTAFVVPLTKDGRLSAKEFIGGKALMTKDQTTYAERVADLGLRRGIENSRAKHQTIQQYYAQLNRQPEPIPEVKTRSPERLRPRPDEPSFFASSATKAAAKADLAKWEQERQAYERQRKEHLAETKQVNAEIRRIAQDNYDKARLAELNERQADKLKHENGKAGRLQKALGEQVAGLAKIVELANHLTPKEIETLKQRAEGARKEAERAAQKAVEPPRIDFDTLVREARQAEGKKPVESPQRAPRGRADDYDFGM